jgi:Ethanolamine utilization protein EutJ (predicted chaperonin)
MVAFGIFSSKWQYMWHNGNHELVGKELCVPATLVDAVEHMARSPFVHLDSDSVHDFVFVTGASSNQFEESFGAVARVQKFFPNYSIVYYDLGLGKNQAKEVGNT